MALRSGAEVYSEAFAAGWALDPDLSISEWADTYRILSSKDSSEAGRWRTARAPYLREVMDVLSPASPIHRVVVMKGAQLGFTQVGNNLVGYTIHMNPQPVLMVVPTMDTAKRVSRQRIDSMIQATPELAERIQPARSRDAGNTMFMKDFTGGTLILTWSNSSAGLRSMPAGILFCDESDEYPADVAGQGDPVELAEARTDTFPRRKIFLPSTPTLRGLSRIENEFLASDQRRYFVPCPFCGHMDWIQWRIGGWRGREGKHHSIDFRDHNPDTAKLRCAGCDRLIDERHKNDMLARGEWRATVQGASPSVAGFHVSSLYSPIGWKSWSGCTADFLEAKDDRFKLKAWVNTVLGETWEEDSTSADADVLLGRTEIFAGEVPAGVGVLVAAVDVQDNRLEVLVTGFGAGEQSWLIVHTVFMGDPGQTKVWTELDDFLREHFEHQSGRKMPIECVAIDSGGHHTDDVYRFCYGRQNRRWFAVRGGSVMGAEVVTKPSNKNRYRIPVFTLGVDTAKDMVCSRLNIPHPGPGYVHLPEWVDKEFVDQLTAEKAIRKYVRGRGSTRVWTKVRDRNEALDLSVYCLAALRILGAALIRKLGERAHQWAAPLEKKDEPPAGEAPAQTTKPPATRPRPRPRGGWMDGYRF